MRKPEGKVDVKANNKLRKGLWSPEEDEKLMGYMLSNGQGCWSDIARNSGLQRCGKSCRLRWINYLRPDLKRGAFSPHEEHLIIHFHSILGNKWSQIAARIPGRTDNEIKNFWNSALKKRLKNNNPISTTTTPTCSPNNESDYSSSELMNVNIGVSGAAPLYDNIPTMHMHNEHDMLMMNMMSMDSSSISSSSSLSSMQLITTAFDPPNFSMLDTSSLPNYAAGFTQVPFEGDLCRRTSLISMENNNNSQVVVDNNNTNYHFHDNNINNCFTNTASNKVDDGDIFGQAEAGGGGSLRAGEEWDFEGFMQDISCFLS